METGSPETATTAVSLTGFKTHGAGAHRSPTRILPPSEIVIVALGVGERGDLFDRMS